MISTTRTPAPVSFGRLASGAMFEHGQSSGRSWRSPAWQRSSRQLPSASTNLRARGIASGFDFLGRALFVGLLNTLRPIADRHRDRCAGRRLGIARLSNVWVAATAARCYLEVIRNTPPALSCNCCSGMR